MYITINEESYPGIRRVKMLDARETLYIGESLDGIESVSGTIGVYRDDGFLLLDDDVESYERVNILPGLLVLTDRPEAVYTEPTDEDELTDSEALSIIIGGDGV